MQIVIKKCEESSYWYNDHIGRWYNVIGFGEASNTFQVDNDYQGYVNVDDCEIVSVRLNGIDLVEVPNHIKLS